MSIMNRRDFLQKTAAVVGSVVGAPAWAVPVATRPATTILRATDVVPLGKTGIKVSRLSIGSGSFGGHEQFKVGQAGVIKLFRHALDQGILWWDTAASYKTYPFVAAALKEIKRDQVVITSKTRKREPADVRKYLDDIRRDYNTDYIDIVLLHCLTDGDWREKMKGPMDVLSEAKRKGIVRAVGCSCHSFEALQATAEEPWIDVNLARINPFALRMDVDKVGDLGKVEKTLRTMHERGKAVYGMKVLAQGDLNSDQIDRSLQFVLTRPYVTAFTIGFSKPEQVNDIVRRVERCEIRVPEKADRTGSRPAA